MEVSARWYETLFDWLVIGRPQIVAVVSRRRCVLMNVLAR
jgi:hypothetical protein